MRIRRLTECELAPMLDEASGSASRHGSRRLVDRIYPGDTFWPFDRLDGQIDHHRLLIAADQYAFQRLVGARVDLQMRDPWRDEDEVARASLRDIFQSFAPAHPGLAPDDIDHALQRAVVMGAGLGVGMDG